MRKTISNVISLMSYVSIRTSGRVFEVCVECLLKNEKKATRFVSQIYISRTVGRQLFYGNPDGECWILMDPDVIIIFFSMKFDPI